MAARHCGANLVVVDVWFPRVGLNHLIYQLIKCVFGPQFTVI